MNKFVIIFSLVFFFQTSSWALNRLLSASTSGEQDVIRLELLFDQGVDASKLNPQFAEKTMTIIIPEATYKKSSTELSPSVSYINDIRIVAAKDKQVAVQFTFVDMQAAQMKENLTMEAAGNSLIVEILPPIWSKPSLAESLPVKENQSLSSVEPVKIETKASNEKEIPLFDKKANRSNESSGFGKIIFMVMGVTLLGGYLIWWLKNRSKMVNGPESLMKIKVLTQFHLGPKKSLLVIRVAGESLLLGVSEDNINLIKTLALLDEDLPEISNESFVEALEEKVKPKASKKVADVESEVALDEEFSFGPAVKTSFSKKIPLLRRLI